MSASVNRSSYTSSQPVRVTALIHNVGSATCEYVGGSKTESLGSCGPISLLINAAKGGEVWPGSAVFHCPAEFEKPLLAGATVKVVGTWQQTDGSAKGSVPRGSYHVVIGGVVSLAISLR
jgi:hypothetical protein